MKDFFKYTIVGVIIFFTCLLIMGMCGCRITKGKKSVQSDSTIVGKADSVHVIKTNSVSVDSSSVVATKTTKTEEVEKSKAVETVRIYDPNTSKLLQIIERQTEDERTTNIVSEELIQAIHVLSQSIQKSDSLNNARYDSLNKRIDVVEKTKDSETKGVGLTLVIIIAIAAVVLGKVALPFKIIKT